MINLQPEFMVVRSCKVCYWSRWVLTLVSLLLMGMILLMNL
jgi:hypothetical protein